MWFKYVWILLQICIIHGGDQFPPLKDDILFRINWPGAEANIKKLGPPGLEYNADDTFIMTSANNERYSCTIPSIVASDSELSGHESGNVKAAHEILAPIFKSGICTYRIEPYWTYEICHGKHIRQYHEERVRMKSASKDGSAQIVLETENGKKIVVQNEDDKNDLIKTTEFFLGHLTDKVDGDGYLVNPGKVPTKADEVTKKKINGVKTPYYAVNMTDGTPCDLKSGSGRRSTVLYVCGQGSRNEIISVSETSSCEYELIILTSKLCDNPLYSLKGQQVNEIQCIALDESPTKPLSLVKHVHEQATDTSRTSQKAVTHVVDDEPKKDEMRKLPGNTISPLVDQSLLKEFLSGSYCLRGGTGWWRFEFCYGKHISQYHDDTNEGRTTVMIGRWDESAHRKWTTLKSSKGRIITTDAKGEKSVSMVAHFYGDGDLCDKTGKPREVVVRMKCKKDASSAHSVTIYLLEPSTCTYILGVESLIFCDLLDSADQHGLLAVDL